MHLFTSLPIVAALDQAANDFIAKLLAQQGKQHRHLVWHPAPDVPNHQLELVNPLFWNTNRFLLSTLPPSELAAFAAATAPEINAQLARRGFEIELDPWDDPNTFGTAGTLESTRRTHRDGETGYRISGIKAGFRRPYGEILLYDTPDGVIAEIPLDATPNQSVFIAPAQQVLSHFKLLNHCARLQYDLTLLNPTTRFTGAIFPQWSVRQKPDVSGLKGLNTTDAGGNRWSLTQAVMECICSFGFQGLFFKAAFAAAVTKEAAPAAKPILPTDYVFNHDVYFWWSLADTSLPFAAGYITTEMFSYEDVSLTA